MELRRPCKMMSTDQWERRILVLWPSSALWLVEPVVGHKNAHQHEWAAILHYLGPFAAYFAPPTLLLPLFIINHFIAPIMIPQLNHQKMGTVDRICPNFGFVLIITRRLGLWSTLNLEVFVAQCRWSEKKIPTEAKLEKVNVKQTIKETWESES